MANDYTGNSKYPETNWINDPVEKWRGTITYAENTTTPKGKVAFKLIFANGRDKISQWYYRNSYGTADLKKVCQALGVDKPEELAGKECLVTSAKNEAGYVNVTLVEAIPEPAKPSFDEVPF